MTSCARAFPEKETDLGPAKNRIKVDFIITARKSYTGPEQLLLWSSFLQDSR